MAGLVFVLLLLSALCMLAMPWLMYVLAPGFAANPEKFDLAVRHVAHRLPLPAVHVAGGAAVGRAQLARQVRRELVRLDRAQPDADGGHAAGAWRSATATTAAPAWCRRGACSPPASCSSSLLVDGVRRNGMLLRLRRPRMTEGVRRLVTLGIPGVIAGGVTQINIVIGTHDRLVAGGRRLAISTTPTASTSCRSPSSASPSASCCCPMCPGTCGPATTPPSWTARTARSSSPCC